jgi:hypothetical protein
VFYAAENKLLIKLYHSYPWRQTATAMGKLLKNMPFAAGKSGN